MSNFGNSLTVENLRKNNFKVRVIHTRDFFPMCDRTGESLHTRREFEIGVNEGYIGRDAWTSPYCMDKAVSYQECVRPTGGFTVVEITTPDGTELRGKCNVNANTQFNKRANVRVALAKAFRGNLPDFCKGL